MLRAKEGENFNRFTIAIGYHTLPPKPYTSRNDNETYKTRVLHKCQSFFTKPRITKPTRKETEQKRSWKLKKKTDKLTNKKKMKEKKIQKRKCKFFYEQWKRKYYKYVSLFRILFILFTKPFSVWHIFLKYPFYFFNNVGCFFLETKPKKKKNQTTFIWCNIFPCFNRLDTSAQIKRHAFKLCTHRFMQLEQHRQINLICGFSFDGLIIKLKNIYIIFNSADDVQIVSISVRIDVDTDLLHIALNDHPAPRPHHIFLIFQIFDCPLSFSLSLTLSLRSKCAMLAMLADLWMTFAALYIFLLSFFFFRFIFSFFEKLILILFLNGIWRMVFSDLHANCLHFFNLSRVVPPPPLTFNFKKKNVYYKTTLIQATPTPPPLIYFLNNLNVHALYSAFTLKQSNDLLFSNQNKIKQLPVLILVWSFFLTVQILVNETN